jgi:parvulin-like peptidyl-prolyl isomerase
MTIDTNNVIPRLKHAVFAARLGRLMGPVSLRGAWLLFKVESIDARRQQPLEAVREPVQEILASQRQDQALLALIRRLRERYKGETLCAAQYRMSECGRSIQ